MGFAKSFTNPTNSNAFLIGAACVSSVLFITNYFQHKKTSGKLKRYLSISTIRMSSANLTSHRGSQFFSQKTDADDVYDRDSLLFIQQEEREIEEEEGKRGGFSKETGNGHYITSNYRNPSSKLNPSQAQTRQTSKPSPAMRPRKIGSVDKKFLMQLRVLLKILIPSWYSKEVFIIALHSVFLLLRTYISIIIAQLDGQIVRYLVQSKGKKFLGGLISWLVIAIPATYTNSMIKYLESKLSIAFRTRLFIYANSLYLNDKLTYYKLLNLDNRIQNPDQYITADITRFCSSLSQILSNIGKPALDMVIFHLQLIQSFGLGATGSMLGFYFISVAVLRKISPSFGKLVATQAAIEGKLRAEHSRVVTNSEEIAFYRGDDIEKKNIESTLFKLIQHSKTVMVKRFGHVFAQDLIIKYIWSSIGYMLIAYPHFRDELLGNNIGSSAAKRMQSFITNKRILINISEAGGRLMHSARQLMELSGYTERVYSLLYTLHSLRIGYYPEHQYTTESQNSIKNKNEPEAEINTELTLAGARGVVYEDFMGIKLTYVPIVVPNSNPYLPGEILVQPLIWHVKPGEHWFVKGPGGIGKTSLLRIISNIWPVFSGILEKPPSNEISYVPHRAYLCIGTLRDQIIYPDSTTQMAENGCTDSDLLEILKIVNLDYLPAREGGFDAIKEWKDVFSGGEQQRICMARLFYHQPNFAVLDECTSAVSYETEGKMYNYAKEIGITLITISHRSALSAYHQYMLRLGDSYASQMPSLGVKTDSIDTFIGPGPGTNLNLNSKNHKTKNSFNIDNENDNALGLDLDEEIRYAGPAWSDAELAALDENEEIIQATSNNQAMHDTEKATKLGAAWQTARLSHSDAAIASLSLSQLQPPPLPLSSTSNPGTGMGDQYISSHNLSISSSTESLLPPPSPGKPTPNPSLNPNPNTKTFNTNQKQKKQIAKTELDRLQNILAQRKQQHTERTKRLADVKHKLYSVNLDPSVVAILNSSSAV